MSLIYRWPLQDNAASRTVVETVAAANALTKVTNTSVASVAGPGGLYPLGLNINGDLNRSIVTPTLSLSTTPVVSVAFWMRLTTLSAIQVFAELSSNYGAAGVNGFIATAEGSNDETTSYVKASGFNGRKYRTQPPLNEWAHYCYLFDFSQPSTGGAEAIQLVNGVELTVFAFDQVSNAANFTSHPMFIGARNQAQFPVFAAYSGLHVFDHRLTAGEIAALIAEGSGGKTAAAVHFFTFGF
jgi:hypothetical protein